MMPHYIVFFSDYYIKFRERTVGVLRYLMHFMIIFGTASVIFGILQLYYGWPNRAWPIVSGVGIWAGAIVSIRHRDGYTLVLNPRPAGNNYRVRR